MSRRGLVRSPERQGQAGALSLRVCDRRAAGQTAGRGPDSWLQWEQSPFGEGWASTRGAVKKEAGWGVTRPEEHSGQDALGS